MDGWFQKDLRKASTNYHEKGQIEFNLKHYQIKHSAHCFENKKCLNGLRLQLKEKLDEADKELSVARDDAKKMHY
jgi:hypothetical protein